MRLINYFPAGYKPRPQQRFIIDEIEKHILAGVKYIIVNAPTGIGKSLIAMTLGNYFKNCYICTGQKSLQDQYMKEFCHMACTVKGKANFECLDYKRERDGHINDCDHGWCTKNKDPDVVCHRTIHPREKDREACESAARGVLYFQSEEEPCLYQVQKAEALKSKIVVTNYDYLLAAINYVHDFGQREVLVSDEGHGLEGHIANFVTVDITQHLLDRLNANCIKKFSFEFTDFNASQEEKFNIHLAYLNKIMKELRVLEHREIKFASDIKLFNNANTKIQFLLDDINENRIKNRDNWVVKEERKDKSSALTKIQFCPVYVNKYAKDLYFNSGGINIIMSATILAKDKEACVEFASDLGIKKNEFEYTTTPQVFSSVNSLIYNLKLANMHYVKGRTPNDEKVFHAEIVNKIDLILELHPDVKGIIHCHTKRISKFIETYTRYPDRIITHDTKNRAVKLTEHCDSRKPTVLCSPSMHEGVDLKDDLSRFQIIVKIPYPNTREERMERRSKIDESYIDRQASLALAQALGRSVRSEQDYARTYTIDSRFDWFIPRNHRYLGGIVKDRVIPKDMVERNLRACHISQREQRILDELFKYIHEI